MFAEVQAQYVYYNYYHDNCNYLCYQSYKLSMCIRITNILTGITIVYISLRELQ